SRLCTPCMDSRLRGNDGGWFVCVSPDEESCMSRTVTFVKRTVISLITLALVYVAPTVANPNNYPQFAQQQVDPAIPIFFIGVERVKEQLDAGRPLVLVDVRSPGE